MVSGGLHYKRFGSVQVMSAFTDGVAKRWFDQLSEDDRRLLETLSQEEWQHGVEEVSDLVEQGASFASAADGVEAVLKSNLVQEFEDAEDDPEVVEGDILAGDEGSLSEYRRVANYSNIDLKSLVHEARVASN